MFKCFRVAHVFYRYIMPVINPDGYRYTFDANGVIIQIKIYMFVQPNKLVIICRTVSGVKIVAQVAMVSALVPVRYCATTS